MMATLEKLAAIVKRHSSPTIDRGDAHGARGQAGYVIYENAFPFIAAEMAKALTDLSLVAEFINENAELRNQVAGFSDELLRLRQKVAHLEG